MKPRESRVQNGRKPLRGTLDHVAQFLPALFLTSHNLHPSLDEPIFYSSCTMATAEGRAGIRVDGISNYGYEVLGAA